MVSLSSELASELTLPLRARRGCSWLCLLVSVEGFTRDLTGIGSSTTSGRLGIPSLAGEGELRPSSGKLRLRVLCGAESSGARNCLARWLGLLDKPGRTGTGRADEEEETCWYANGGLARDFGSRSKYSELGLTCVKPPLETLGRGGRSGRPSLGRSSSRSSFGVARLRSALAHCSCHFSISGSAMRGKAVVGRSMGKGCFVSGWRMGKFEREAWMKGTCSSGPRRISMDCQRTKPRVVRAGMQGGRKSSFGVGWSVC